jgi:uncharacterized protein DUF4440
MRTFLLILLVLLAGCAPRQDSAAEADRTLVAAINGGDELTALELIDDDVTWTDKAGRTLTKRQLEDMWPSPAIAGEKSAEARAFDHGRVTVVRIDRGRLHTLRVWGQRPVGWRLLVYQEVESLASPPAAAPPGIGHDCVNPCTKLPYEPKTGNERGVITAYQALETAAHAADVDNWGRYVADEFVVVSSNSDQVLTKATRLEGLRKAAYGGVSPSPLVSAQLLDFDTVVVMRARHKPESGNPLQIARVWVQRNGAWLSVLSYQTAITAPD